MHVELIVSRDEWKSVALKPTVLVVLQILLLRLLQLLLPELVGLAFLNVGKDKLEDILVPVDGLAFNALFDVLR